LTAKVFRKACPMVSSVPLASTPERDHSTFGSEEDVTRPMCGQGVLTKLLLKKSPTVPSSSNSSSSFSMADSSPGGTRNCIVPGKGAPFSRRRYDEVTRHLLASPEDTESSSTSSDKSSDDNHRAAQASTSTAGPYLVQFVHSNGTGAAVTSDGYNNNAETTTASTSSSTTTAAPRTQRQQMVQPLVFPRNGLWSTPLSAVTEETSSVETEETPRDKEPASMASALNASSSSSSKANKFTSPEKEEMLEAMRTLVLKQQAALKELSKENSHFRKKMEEYQNMLIKMKRVSAEKEGRISAMQLEKEAIETESMYLRGQVESLKARLQESMDYEDDDVQQKLRNLMVGGKAATGATTPTTPSRSSGVKPELFSPSSTAEQVATDAFNSFKRTLSPGTVMDRAVKSLNCSKDPTWGWDMKDGEAANEEDETGGEESDANSITSESVPDDERIMSITPVRSSNKVPKASAPNSWTSSTNGTTESRDDQADAPFSTPGKLEATRTPPNTAVKSSPADSLPSYSDPVVWRPPPPPLSGKSYTPTRSQQQPPPQSSLPPLHQQREEVDVFKQRLDSLQKRRSDRQSERKQQQTSNSTTNKPTVRFGTISI
jgi:hypothetical protein